MKRIFFLLAFLISTVCAATGPSVPLPATTVEITYLEGADDGFNVELSEEVTQETWILLVTNFETSLQVVAKTPGTENGGALLAKLNENSLTGLPSFASNRSGKIELAVNLPQMFYGAVSTDKGKTWNVYGENFPKPILLGSVSNSITVNAKKISQTNTIIKYSMLLQDNLFTDDYIFDFDGTGSVKHSLYDLFDKSQTELSELLTESSVSDNILVHTCTFPRAAGYRYVTLYHTTPNNITLTYELKNKSTGEVIQDVQEIVVSEEFFPISNMVEDLLSILIASQDDPFLPEKTVSNRYAFQMKLFVLLEQGVPHNSDMTNMGLERNSISSDYLQYYDMVLRNWQTIGNERRIDSRLNQLIALTSTYTKNRLSTYFNIAINRIAPAITDYPNGVIFYDGYTRIDLNTEVPTDACPGIGVYFETSDNIEVFIPDATNDFGGAIVGGDNNSVLMASEFGTSLTSFEEKVYNGLFLDNNIWLKGYHSQDDIPTTAMDGSVLIKSVRLSQRVFSRMERNRPTHLDELNGSIAEDEHISLITGFTENVINFDRQISTNEYQQSPLRYNPLMIGSSYRWHISNDLIGANSIHYEIRQNGAASTAFNLQSASNNATFTIPQTLTDGDEVTFTTKEFDESGLFSRCFELKRITSNSLFQEGEVILTNVGRAGERIRVATFKNPSEILTQAYINSIPNDNIHVRVRNNNIRWAIIGIGRGNDLYILGEFKRKITSDDGLYLKKDDIGEGTCFIDIGFLSVHNDNSSFTTMWTEQVNYNTIGYTFDRHDDHKYGFDGLSRLVHTSGDRRDNEYNKVTDEPSISDTTYMNMPAVDDGLPGEAKAVVKSTSELRNYCNIITSENLTLLTPPNLSTAESPITVQATSAGRDTGYVYLVNSGINADTLDTIIVHVYPSKTRAIDIYDMSGQNISAQNEYQDLTEEITKIYQKGVCKADVDHVLISEGEINTLNFMIPNSYSIYRDGDMYTHSRERNPEYWKLVDYVESRVTDDRTVMISVNEAYHAFYILNIVNDNQRYADIHVRQYFDNEKVKMDALGLIYNNNVLVSNSANDQFKVVNVTHNVHAADGSLREVESKKEYLSPDDPCSSPVYYWVYKGTDNRVSATDEENNIYMRITFDHSLPKSDKLTLHMPYSGADSFLYPTKGMGIIPYRSGDRTKIHVANLIAHEVLHAKPSQLLDVFNTDNVMHYTTMEIQDPHDPDKWIVKGPTELTFRPEVLKKDFYSCRRKPDEVFVPKMISEVEGTFRYDQYENQWEFMHE